MLQMFSIAPKNGSKLGLGRPGVGLSMRSPGIRLMALPLSIAPSHSLAAANTLARSSSVSTSEKASLSMVRNKAIAALFTAASTSASL